MTRFEYRRLELELAAAQSAVDSLATGKFPDAYELAVRARDVAQARFTAATPPPPDPEQPMVEAQRDATEHWARVDADALARADAAGTSAAA